MPPVLVAIASAVVDVAITLSPEIASATIFGVTLGTTGAAIIGGLAAAGITALGTFLLTPAQKRTLTVRSPIASHKVIMGQMKVGGALTFIDTTSNNQTLFLVITLAGHPVFSIDGLYVNDTYVPINASTGQAQKPVDWPDGTKPTDYTGHCQVFKGLGTVAGDAGFLAAISAASAKWAPNFFQSSRAKIYVRLGWNTNLFGSTGVPNISCVVRGRMILDPRDTAITITTSSSGTPGVFNTSTAHGFPVGQMVFIKQHVGAVPVSQPTWPAAQRNSVAQEYEIGSVPSSTRFTLIGTDSQPLALTGGGTGGTVTAMQWSDNSALVTEDYLVEPIHGMAVIYDTEVNETLLIANANLCDEIVARILPTSTFTADPTLNQITYVENQAAGSLPPLCQVLLSTTGSLPGGLSAGPYYYAQVGGGPVGVLCTSSANAAHVPPINVDITSAGTGVQTLTIVESVTPDFTTSQLGVYNNALRITTGTEVILSNIGGSVPTGLSASTSYYAIFLSDIIIQLASSLENARLGKPIAFSNNGSGTSFVSVEAEPRYTANGIIDTQESRQTIIQKLLTSMGGYLVPSGTLLNVYPAQYLTPTVTFDEGDLRGPISATTLQSGATSFNSVKGTFVDPFNKGQPTDYPYVQNTSYIAADQYEVVWKDLTLEFTNSSSMSQRLAKIDLERIRRELTVTMPLKLTAFQVGSPDVVYVNNTMWGWSAETFELSSWRFSVQAAESNAATLNCDVVGRQTDSAVYAWTSAEETAAKRQTNTNLPNPFVVAAPTGLVLISGGSLVVIQQDGTLVSQVGLSWITPNDNFVTDGGFIEILWQVSGATSWTPAPAVPGAQNFAYIQNAKIGSSINVCIRSRNAIGAVSDVSPPYSCIVNNYVVLGKTGVPSDIGALNVVQSNALLILSGSPIPDTDVACFEYRYGATQNWNAMTLIETPLARPTSGGETAVCTVAGIPTGTWWFGVKAKDTSGNYSINAAFANFSVTSSTAVKLSAVENAPGWANFGAGTGVGFLRHWSGVIYPDSTVLASAMTDSDLWNTFNSAPVTTAIYEAPTIDLGSNQVVTVLANPLTYVNGPGVSGSPTVAFQIDFWLSGGSDPNTWTTVTSTVITARFIRTRINHTPGSVPAVFLFFTPEVDGNATSNQSGTQICASGGTSVTFSPAFHSTPNINATAQGANVAWITGPSATGFTLHVGPDTSHDNGGTASWTANGA